MTQATEFTTGKLIVKTYTSRLEMGVAAASDAAERIKALLAAQPAVNIIFAAAPSQSEFLEALSKMPGIDWHRINAFHMDEYIGLQPGAPETFAAYLQEQVFRKAPFGNVFFINGAAPEPLEECHRYAALLRAHPADIVCMGIGENTHIAFNDPHTADFNDPSLVKLVSLDDVSRQQQVNDGCFPNFEAVPVYAITLTVPALMKAKHIFCMVPGRNKALAVEQTVREELNPRYPSTVLKTHPDAVLYLDADSAAKLDEIY